MSAAISGDAADPHVAALMAGYEISANAGLN
jgi:hypothetical protein